MQMPPIVSAVKREEREREIYSIVVLSKKENRNGVSRSFLLNYKKFLALHYKELDLSVDQRIEVSEAELPKLSGKAKERLVRPLSEQEILTIEKCMDKEKHKLMLLMSYYGGLRVGELMKIQVSSFNWQDWKKDMSKYGECRVYGKGDKEGIAFFPPEIMKRIALYIRSSDFPSPSSFIFFKNKENIKNLDVENMAWTWRKTLKKASIDAGVIQFDSNGKIIKDSDVYPHRLRHSRGHYLKTVKKMDIRDIKEILRHSSIQTTQRYTYTDKSYIKNLLEKEISD